MGAISGVALVTEKARMTKSCAMVLAHRLDLGFPGCSQLLVVGSEQLLQVRKPPIALTEVPPAPT